MITGCSKNDDAPTSVKENTKAKVAMGRYVEKMVALPKGIGQDTTIQLTQKEGKPFLYTFRNANHKYTIKGYELSEDGTWKEHTPRWMNSVKPSSTTYMDSVFEDKQGNQYLYYSEIKDNSYKGNLLCSRDGGTYKSLKPETWSDKDPKSKLYNTPSKVNVLDDGTIVALFNNGQVDFYNSKSLKREHTLSDSSYMDTDMVTSGQSVYLIKLTENYKAAGVDVINASDDYAKTNYAIKSTLSGMAFLNMKANNDITLCDPDGVHVLKQGTTTWQTVLDGTLTSLSMQTLYCNGFTADSADNYYALLSPSGGGSYSLMKYTYDKSIASVPSKELTVYSLTENAILRQTASIFQKNNPDVKVTFKTAMSEEEFAKAEATTKEDYIRALNTELLAGKGPDILVLDNLPVESFLQKKILTNLNDVVQPMIDRDELFSNITDGYKTDGSFYYIPARISLNLLNSNKANVKNLSTLKDLADYAALNQTKSLLGKMTLQDFIQYFAPYYKDQILDANGKLNKQNLVNLLKNLKAISDSTGIIDQYPDVEKGANRPNIFSIVSGTAQLNIQKCNGFTDAMFQYASVTQAKGSYISFENSYTPSSEVGINKTSKNQKICKEFIKLLLSKDIQKNDLRDGFPLNKKAFQEVVNQPKNNMMYGVSSSSDKGTPIRIDIYPLSPKQKKPYLDLCNLVSKKTVTDDHITKVFLDETKDFFSGNLSAEETANRILVKINTYLSE